MRRGEQYFLYVFPRAKMFQVDELIAEIARYNGKVSATLLETLLHDRFEKGALQGALDKVRNQIPEVLSAG